jgi:UDP-N-acetyl-D-mannosaminuronate dehydrogenase
MNYDIAVVGAGYVGLPLSTAFAEAGCHVLVVDVIEQVVEALNRGEPHIEDVERARWAPLVERGLVRATTDYGELKQA